MVPQVTGLRRLDNAGSLRALASVQIGSVLLHDFRVVQQAGQRAFVQPPQRTYIDPQTGKSRFYGPLVELPDDVLKVVQNLVLDAYHQEKENKNA